MQRLALVDASYHVIPPCRGSTSHTTPQPDLSVGFWSSLPPTVADPPAGHMHLPGDYRYSASSPGSWVNTLLANGVQNPCANPAGSQHIAGPNVARAKQVIMPCGFVESVRVIVLDATNWGTFDRHLLPATCGTRSTTWPYCSALIENSSTSCTCRRQGVQQIDVHRAIADPNQGFGDGCHANIGPSGRLQVKCRVAPTERCVAKFGNVARKVFR